jgi:hypothetical protein
MAINKDEIRTLLYANPHRFGAGKIHVLKSTPEPDSSLKTLCGRTLEECPGERRNDSLSKVTCKACWSSLESADKWQRWQQEHREWQLQQQLQAEKENRQWWEAYNKYLQSPAWIQKRQLVRRRSGGICEGCGQQNAVVVHHRNYPKDVIPGSAEWVRAEKLFDLVDLCGQYHRDLHPDRLDEPNSVSFYRASCTNDSAQDSTKPMKVTIL